MTTLHHPNMPLSIDVPDADAKQWQKQGWRTSAPAPLNPDPSPATGEETSKEGMTHA